jgi:hypothetical protein
MDSLTFAAGILLLAISAVQHLYIGTVNKRVDILKRRVDALQGTLDDHGIYSGRPPVGLDAPPHRER